MAKQRYINTKFWADNFIAELSPIERYLFLYFLTNEHTNIGGVYELPMRNILFETGVEKTVVEEAMHKFSTAGKIYLIDGWVYVKNFAKHQSVNEKTKIGIENSLKAAAPHVLAKIKEIENGYTEGIHGVSMGYQDPSQGFELSESKLELESKLESKSICETSVSRKVKRIEKPENSQIPEVIKLFEVVNPSIAKLYGNKTQRAACSRLLQKWKLEEIRDLVHGVLPRLNADTYAKGKSITPLQFEDNLGYIKAFIEKNKPITAKNYDD